MSAIKISEKLSVSPQPSVDVIRSLRSLGFTTLINNRPDAEDALQPGTDAEKQAGEHCGLSYSFVPVTLGTITEADVRSFQKALDDSGGPVFAHCKSGTRSLSLYLIGEVLDGRMAVRTSSNSDEPTASTLVQLRHGSSRTQRVARR